MKTRIRCTEVTVNDVVTKTYRAEVFCWWHRGSSYFWSPAIGMLNDVDYEAYWADEEQLKEFFGGYEPSTEERAKALIDRLLLKIGEQRKAEAAWKDKKRQEKSSKRPHLTRIHKERNDETT